MEAKEIIEKAKQLKINRNHINVMELSSKLGIEIGYNSLNPKACAAYIIQYNDFTKIILNRRTNFKTQNVLCAHELGHALLHKHTLLNHFGDKTGIEEYEANLFAVALLFDEKDFSVPLNKMTNFELKSILDNNINLEPAS